MRYDEWFELPQRAPINLLDFLQHRGVLVSACLFIVLFGICACSAARDQAKSSQAGKHPVLKEAQIAKISGRRFSFPTDVHANYNERQIDEAAHAAGVVR